MQKYNIFSVKNTGLRKQGEGTHRYNCRDDVNIVSTLRLALFTEPYTLIPHHLPYADDAAVADQFDQVNAMGVG